MSWFGRSDIERYADIDARIGRSDLGEREDPPMTLAEFTELERERDRLASKHGWPGGSE